MNSNENTQPLTDDATAEAAAPTRRHRRNLLIGLGAAVALVAMGGGAYAIASSNDGHDDGTSSHATAGTDQSDDHSTTGHDDDGDDDRHDDDLDDDDSNSSSAPLAASDEAALRAAAEKAITEVKGEGVTSIEVERGGYDVDVLLADGTEVDVFVSTDGTVRTDKDDDSDDDSSDPLLDLAKLGDILAAAQSAATDKAGAAGTVESISTDDDSSKAYEVELRLDDRREVEVELAGDLTVVTVEIDD